MPYNTLLLSPAESSRIATITFNRPDKRNAVSYELIEELARALDEVKHSPAQALILTGNGKAFCAGMDLDDLKGLLGRTHEQNLADSRKMASLFRAVYDFPLPTIAAVNGAAIAGGTGIATICDFTLAVPEAKFGYTEVKIGFVPAIVSTFLVRQVGEKVARDLLLTGRLFDAAEAHRIGLVHEIVAPEQLLRRAHLLATQLLENSPASLRATKELLSAAVNEELDRQIERAVEGERAHPARPRFPRRHHRLSRKAQAGLGRLLAARIVHRFRCKHQGRKRGPGKTSRNSHQSSSPWASRGPGSASGGLGQLLSPPHFWSGLEVPSNAIKGHLPCYQQNRARMPHF